MGNCINSHYSHKSFLLSPVNDSLSFLTRWKKLSIKSFYNTYESLYSPHTNLSILEFQKILKHCQIEFQQDIIFKYFSNKVNKTINFLELIAVIITYSITDIEEKVELAMMVFDFDHSNRMSKDEMKIMCKCFLKGLRIATGEPKSVGSSKENYMAEVFKNADYNFDGQLVKSE